MKKPNLTQLIQCQHNNQVLKAQANELANELIIEYDINDGYQMAGFLKLSQGLDNYTAIRIWVEKWLKTYYPVVDSPLKTQNLPADETLYRKLKQKFLTQFPQAAVA